MKIVEKAGKMKCDHCKLDFNIPAEGKYKIHGDKYCPLDNF